MISLTLPWVSPQAIAKRVWLAPLYLRSNPRLRADLVPAPEVGAKDLDRGRVERQPPFLVGLGVLDDPLAAVADVSARYQQVGFLPADVGPADRDELAGGSRR